MTSSLPTDATGADVFSTDLADRWTVRFTDAADKQQPGSNVRMQQHGGAESQRLPHSMRHVLAQAAMQRAAQQATTGPAGSAQRQMPDSNAIDQTASNSACSTAPEQAHGAAQDSNVEHVSAVIDLVDDCSQPDMNASSNLNKEERTKGMHEQSCPVCGLSWPKITAPEVMYQHVDECLQQQLL